MPGINTTTRYLFINLYAWILLLGAAIIGITPLYKINLWLIIIQVAGGVTMTIFAIRILMQFPRKRREYDILVERNSEELRPDTFWCYADVPCGRLLMWLVLKDLGYDRKTYRDIVKQFA